MTNFRKLFIGAVSDRVISSIFTWNKSNSQHQIGVLPTRRQVESSFIVEKHGSGGYVGRYPDIKTLSNACHSANTVIERDHAGPKQGTILSWGNLEDKCDDSVQAIISDVNDDVDIIHIDPWKTTDFHVDDRAFDFTITTIRNCLDSAKTSQALYFEVGTERSIFSYNSSFLTNFLHRLQENLHFSQFAKIAYAVVQSGVSIDCGQNSGDFYEDETRKMCDVCHDFGINTKEHNSDYLTQDDFRKRVEAGVDSFNIAPEVARLETELIREFLISRGQKAFWSDFVVTCQKSLLWSKWFSTEGDPDFMAQNMGHYILGKMPSDHNHLSDFLERNKAEIDSIFYEKFAVRVTSIFDIFNEAQSRE